MTEKNTLRFLKALPLIFGVLFVSHGYPETNDTGSYARNPVLWADVPDPSVIRVGDTYYMSSTTMHLSPGLPVMKSTDLVNWEIASYAHGNLVENARHNLERGQNAYGSGSWASSLRYHNGKFYLTTFSYSSNLTHVYITEDPDEGPWEEVNFSPAFHDMSLVFEDDRVYMAHGTNNIRLTELREDLTGPKPDGFDEVIIRDSSRVAGDNVGLPAEGAQIFKVGDTYYTFLITWPRGGMRTALVFRSDDLKGPYEGRVALRDRGIAQGSLVDTPDGDWYAIMHQDAGAVGRILHVIPVTWEDGWPVLGVDGVVPTTLEGLPPNPSIPAYVGSDDFDDSALSPIWQWNHNPVDDYWSLSDRPGFLRLTTDRVDEDFLQSRNMLTQRTFGPESAASTRVDVSGMKAGDVAGMTVLQRDYGYVAVKAEDDSKSIVMVGVDSGQVREHERVSLETESVHFKIECDFNDRRDRAYFYFSLDGESWTRIGEPLQMRYTLPHFMGYRFGLFTYATESSGGYVDFDYYRVVDSLTQRD